MRRQFIFPFLISVLLFTTGIIVAENESGQNTEYSNVPSLELDVGYNETAEILEITFVESNFTEENTDALLIRPYSPVNGSEVLVRSGNNTFGSNYVIGGFNSLKPPIEGETIEFVKDGNDLDRDGIKGVDAHPVSENYQEYYLVWFASNQDGRAIKVLKYENGRWVAENYAK